MTFRETLYATVLVVVTACGGGGGDAIPAEPPQLPATALSTLSYENRHQAELYSSTLPAGVGQPSARAFFRMPDGSLGLYAANIGSYPGRTGADINNLQAGPSFFYKQVNGTWQNVSNEVYDSVNSAPNCVHPRKVMPADYNQDGIIDFAVACHGWDGPPYPGERSRIILSQPDGRYKQEYLSSVIEFNHGGTAGDLNGDGYPDIMLTKMNTDVDVYINDKTGHFVKSNDYSIPQQRRAFHITLVDVNSDGKFDFIGGSHEWDDSTRIILNPGDNNFGGSLFNRPTEIIIPPVPGAGVIVDFLYVKSVNSLYILRTGGSGNSDPAFYKGIWLQKFTLDSKLSTVEYANSNWTSPVTGGPWFPWIVEHDGKIVSDYGTAFVAPIQ